VSARRKTGVIDQAARRRLAEGVRHLANGRITNDEFEDHQYGRAAAASTDPGVRAVFWQGALVVGTQSAHVTVLAAARHALLKRVGWDVEQHGKEIRPIDIGIGRPWRQAIAVRTGDPIKGRL
jgi:hypothetical protein